MSFTALTRKISESTTRQNRERHEILPWIASPFKGVNIENIIFHQRHEASSAELFFDLFFVANLATFTAYHAVVDTTTLKSYIGFFTILWTTWFQITLYDVRFTRDSIWERVCKLVQLTVFVVFAYAGSKFNPEDNEGDPLFYRTMATALAVSRLLLALQYIAVLGYAIGRRASRVYLPLGLCIAALIVSLGIFAGFTQEFEPGPEARMSVLDKTKNVFYAVVGFEAIVVLGVAMIWRTLSFKKTHIVERMGLLTLIVIGEGAIGVTKTVTKLMGKHGLQLESSGLIFCIILILFFLWVIYFDNQPEHHYGTIRQQIYCILHFPLHLCIVGVVEGSQQLSQARYVLASFKNFAYHAAVDCFVDNLTGQELMTALEESLEYYHLSDYKSYKYVEKALKEVEKSSSVMCTLPNLRKLPLPKGLPKPLFKLSAATMGSLFESMGMKLPKGDDPVTLAASTYVTVYDYVFAALTMVLAIFAIFLALTRKNRHDSFDIGSVVIRVLLAIMTAVLCIVGHKNVDFKIEYISSVMMLPTIVITLTVIIITDRVMRVFANWRLKKNGLYPEDLEVESKTPSDVENEETITFIDGGHLK